MDLSYWLITFLHTLSFGYICVTPLLFTSWFLLRKYKKNLLSLIAVSNGWFGIGNLLWIVSFGKELFYAWHSQNTYEGYSFYYSRTDIFSPYGFAFWVRLLIIPVSILFLFKKIRGSVLATAIMLTCLLFTNERFVIFITSKYRDCLPSSWNTTQQRPWWENDFIYLSVYLLLISGTYFIQPKKAKHLAS